MATQLEQVRDQQQATWDKFSAGWKKWDELVLGWLVGVGTELLDGARRRPDSYVLEIASGTGEPALSAAAARELARVARPGARVCTAV